MTRRLRKLLGTTVVVTLALLLPPLAGLAAAEQWTAHQARNRLDTYAGITVDHAERILAAAGVTLDDLAGRIDRRCTDDTVKALARAVYDSLYFREAGLIVDDRLACTSLQRLDPPVPITTEDHRVPGDDALHIAKPEPTLDGTISIIVLRRIGAHAAVNLLVNPLQFGDSLQRLFGGSPVRVLIERSDGSELLRIGAMPDAGEPSVVRTSSRFPLRAVVQAPRAWLQRGVWRSRALGGGIGLLLSALLAPLVLRRARRRLSLAEELRDALDAGELRVHYQPVMDARTGECVGAEALLRWQHAERGLLLPEQFLSAADEPALMLSITAWVLRRIVAEMAALLAAYPNFHISLNLNPILLKVRGLPAMMVQALGGKVPPWRIVFEITEQQLMSAEDAGVVTAVDALRETGALLALDDFGTGYSSLKSLSQFPFDYLKIDKLFVDAIGTASATAQMVSTIVDLARRLDLEIVAEGVENAGQLDHLRTLGVQFVQGWYFSKSLTAAEFVRFADGHRGRSLAATAPDDTA